MRRLGITPDPYHWSQGDKGSTAISDDYNSFRNRNIREEFIAGSPNRRDMYFLAMEIGDDLRNCWV